VDLQWFETAARRTSAVSVGLELGFELVECSSDWSTGLYAEFTNARRRHHPNQLFDLAGRVAPIVDLPKEGRELGGSLPAWNAATTVFLGPKAGRFADELHDTPISCKHVNRAFSPEIRVRYRLGVDRQRRSPVAQHTYPPIDR